MPAVCRRRTASPTAAALPRDVEAALGGELLAALGHQAGVRPARSRQPMPTISGVTAISRFTLVRTAASSALDVAILDVAAILAQVHGDAVGAAPLRRQRRLDDVRIRRAARLADRGDVVDVDAEEDHGERA